MTCRNGSLTFSMQQNMILIKIESCNSIVNQCSCFRPSNRIDRLIKSPANEPRRVCAHSSCAPISTLLDMYLAGVNQQEQFCFKASMSPQPA